MEVEMSSHEQAASFSASWSNEAVACLLLACLLALCDYTADADSHDGHDCVYSVDVRR